MRSRTGFPPKWLLLLSFVYNAVTHRLKRLISVVMRLTALYICCISVREPIATMRERTTIGKSDACQTLRYHER